MAHYLKPLTLTDTNALKGIAIILMLVHHLFYIQRGLYDDIVLPDGHGIVNVCGIMAKVCVAIFVFLSGYGLAVQARKRGIDTKQFYYHRFVKLYLNYWFIWLLFVPIGIFCFGRTFEAVYGSHVAMNFLLDFFGIINVFGGYGYNATWWFYSAIIVLYLLFPMLYRWCDNYPLFMILAAVSVYFLPLPVAVGARLYFPTFIIGILAHNNLNNSELPPPVYAWCCCC